MDPPIYGFKIMKLHLNYKMSCTKNILLIKWFLPIPIEQFLLSKQYKHLKNHFKAALSTPHPNLPIAEWNRLLPHTFLTLNLLKLSTVNSQLSAYAYIFGQFDFNKTPLAPPGFIVETHTKPSNRAS